MPAKTRSSSPIRSAVLETLESRRLLSVTAPADYVRVGGDIEVDSDGTATQTGIILEAGVQYFVKATGTYTIAPGRLADAEFLQENSAGHPWIKGADGLPLVTGVSDWGDTRDTSTTPEYGGFFTGIPDEGKGATGNQFTPRLNDTYYNDNAGSLMVELYRQIPTVTIEPANVSGVSMREGTSGQAFIVKRSFSGGALDVTIALPSEFEGVTAMGTPGEDYALQTEDGLAILPKNWARL